MLNFIAVMQTSLDHLPEKRQVELKKITQIVLDSVEVEKIILFGSFARGDWVSDTYMEGHITYEYQSDFDILIIVKSPKLEKNSSLWNELQKKIDADPQLVTPVNIIVDTIHFVNKRLLEGNYFYVDIKKEGVLLYDSGNFNLSEPGTLSPHERKVLAQRDYDFWFGKAQSFLKDYQHNIEDSEFNNAAFHLHQVTEALFVASLLVLTGYRPKTHDLAKIENLLVEKAPEFAGIFPKETHLQKHRFDLLRRAYVDARYKADYSITLEELKYLEERILMLKDLVEKVCTAQINSSFETNP